MARFIRIQNKAVNVDQIAYIDFLDSGRAMVFVSGLTQEKQHIAVEPAEARMLLELFEREYSLPASATTPAANVTPGVRALTTPRF